MALHSHTVYSSPEVQIRHVKCCPEHYGLSDVEIQDSDTLVLPIKGCFVKHLGAHREFTADSSAAVLMAKGRPYRISHPSELADECVTIELGRQLLESALTDGPGVAGFDHSSLHPVVRTPFRLSVLRTVMLHRINHHIADGLEISENCLWIVASAVCLARSMQSVGKRNTPTARRHRDQVAIVQSVLENCGDSVPSLSLLAIQAQTTPFHLARIFRNHTGLPVHEYDLRLRLIRALPDITDTDKGLTQIALDHGFSSHSHFTFAFRRRSGLPPSEIRRVARHGTRWQMSKIVTALAGA